MTFIVYRLDTTLNNRGSKTKSRRFISCDLYLLRHLEGREEANEVLERSKFIQWMNFSKQSDGELAVRKCPVSIFSDGASSHVG